MNSLQVSGLLSVFSMYWVVVQGAKMPHAVAETPKHKNKKQYCNKFNTGFKNDSHKKIFFLFKKGLTQKSILAI